MYTSLSAPTDIYIYPSSSPSLSHLFTNGNLQALNVVTRLIASSPPLMSLFQQRTSYTHTMFQCPQDCSGGEDFLPTAQSTSAKRKCGTILVAPNREDNRGTHMVCCIPSRGMQISFQEAVIAKLTSVTGPIVTVPVFSKKACKA